MKPPRAFPLWSVGVRLLIAPVRGSACASGRARVPESCPASPSACQLQVVCCAKRAAWWRSRAAPAPCPLPMPCACPRTPGHHIWPYHGHCNRQPGVRRVHPRLPAHRREAAQGLQLGERGLGGCSAAALTAAHAHLWRHAHPSPNCMRVCPPHADLHGHCQHPAHPGQHRGSLCAAMAAYCSQRRRRAGGCQRPQDAAVGQPAAHEHHHAPGGAA